MDYILLTVAVATLINSIATFNLYWQSRQRTDSPTTDPTTVDSDHAGLV